MNHIHVTRNRARLGMTILAAGTLCLLLSHAAARSFQPPADMELPVVRFETAAAWAHPQDGLVPIALELSQPVAHDVRVAYTVGGTARIGRDVRFNGGVIEFPAGARTAHLLAEVLDGGLREGESRAAFVSLVDPVGARLAGHATHTLAIGLTVLGGPREDLTPSELEAFERGKVMFEKRFTPEEGLGPFYNATSCESCHSSPVTGGTAKLYRNFYLGVYQFGATPNSQSTSIPPFLSQVVPAFGSGPLHNDAKFTLTGGRPLLPETVLGFPVISAQRNSIPIFGVGLFEEISDGTILANADPFDLNGDGISGRINTQLNGSVLGRFGMKSQSNNIELFTRAPLQNQMGITSNPFLGEDGLVHAAAPFFQASGNPNDPTIDDDGVPDPEISHEDLGDLIAFTRFLAPPEPKPFSEDALAGEALFAAARCTDCHIPSLPSSKGPVNAYTDLLLHYMGPDLVDNMRFGESPVAITDFRTAPLWGISLAAPYLHDGRAATLEEAIAAHAGEAETSRDLYLAMTEAERDQLIAFLEHL